MDLPGLLLGHNSGIQQVDGRLGYKCFHDSCQSKGWREARQVISGTDNLKDFMLGEQAPRTDKAGDKPELTIVTMGEIHRMKKEFPEPLIDGLLERGDSLLISGQGGLGKSLLAIKTKHHQKILQDFWQRLRFNN